MIIFVISPFLSTHWNDRKWLRITKIITWQKSLYTYIVNTFTPNYRIEMICRNSPMVHEHIEQPGILAILSENKQAPQQCQPLWTKALSNLIYMEDFLNWIWGIGTQKHRGIYEDLMTMYFYITLSLSKVEIMKWEHCWTGKELSAF